MADQREKPLQIQSLSECLALVIPGFDQVIYPDWDALFSRLDSYTGERFTLSLDEFPYLLKMAPELFSVWGGVPRYWELQKGFTGVEEALLYHVLDPDGVLYKEPELLFNDEWRTSVQAYSILALIGSGINRISEIAARLEKPATHLSRAIQLLVELEYVRREVPFGVSERSSNKSLYKISDPFMAFYFTFVVPHKSRLEYGLKDRVWDLVRARFNRHISGIWEELCRQGTPGLDAGPVAFNPGSRWWGRIAPKKDLEIDLVAESVDGSSILIGEIKWSDQNKAGEWAETLKP